MEDFEKNRVEYVQTLETQVKHLQRQLNDLQAQNQWIPEVGTVMDSKEEAARITVSFGGKRVTITLAYPAIRETDVTSLTSAVLDSLHQNLFADRFRGLIAPQIEAAKQNIGAIAGAGKW